MFYSFVEFGCKRKVSWRLVPLKSLNIDASFEFLFTYLINDDGPLFLFVYEKKNIRDDVRIFATSNDFVVGTIFGFQIIVIVFLN